MNAEERERQRVAWLRETQIRTRDPGPSKIRNYDWSRQKAAPKRPPLLVELFGVFPTRIRSLALGIVFGTVIALLISLLAPALAVIGVLFIPVAAVAGWILGKVLESQE